MRMEMDRKSRVKSWTELGMTNPFETGKYQKRAREYIF